MPRGTAGNTVPQLRGKGDDVADSVNKSNDNVDEDPNSVYATAKYILIGTLGMLATVGKCVVWTAKGAAFLAQETTYPLKECVVRSADSVDQHMRPYKRRNYQIASARFT